MKRKPKWRVYWGRFRHWWKTKGYVWRLRYAWTMWRVIGEWGGKYRGPLQYPRPSLYRDWRFSWLCSASAYADAPYEDPVDSAEDELSYWSS